MATTALAFPESGALEAAPPTSLAQFGEMSKQSLVARRQKTKEIFDEVLVEGVHYGKIPGAGDKPSLYKAGAEVLAMTFGLAPTFQIRRSDFPGGHREYEITCQLRHVATGVLLGEGLGSCSTMESKYRWRVAQRKCPSCGNSAIVKSRFADRDTGDIGWWCSDRKGGCGANFHSGTREIVEQSFGKIENPDVADTYNTVLKMAKKRAQVDATLTALGVSDLATQDLEDHEPEERQSIKDANPPNESKAKRSNAKKAAKSGSKEDEDAVSTAPPNSTDDRKVDPLAEKIADKIIEQLKELAALEIDNIDDAKARVADASKLYNEINRLPKGTRARGNAKDVFDRLFPIFKAAAATPTNH